MDSPSSVRNLCDPQTSPVAKTAEAYLQMLEDENEEWIVVIGEERIWSERLYSFVLAGVLTMVGGLFHRCIMPYLQWPWPLAMLCSP